MTEKRMVEIRLEVGDQKSVQIRIDGVGPLTLEEAETLLGDLELAVTAAHMAMREENEEETEELVVCGDGCNLARGHEGTHHE
jgi:hypothetical protein